MSFANSPRVISKILVSAAIALAAWIGGAAPASADPNPFGVLSCSCRTTTTTDSLPPGDGMNQAIQHGISDGLSERPAPAQASRLRP
jgi:hypothetical protein